MVAFIVVFYLAPFSPAVLLARAIFRRTQSGLLCDSSSPLPQVPVGLCKMVPLPTYQVPAGLNLSDSIDVAQSVNENQRLLTSRRLHLSDPRTNPTPPRLICHSFLPVLRRDPPNNQASDYPIELILNVRSTLVSPQESVPLAIIVTNTRLP